MTHNSSQMNSRIRLLGFLAKARFVFYPNCPKPFKPHILLIMVQFASKSKTSIHFLLSGEKSELIYTTLHSTTARVFEVKA